MKPDAVREAVAALRCRLDDIRDERHFPAHMLDVHDEMLSVLDGIEHVTGIDSRTGEACRSVAQALKQAFQEADPDATHRFDWADFGDYKLTDKGQAVVDALIRRLGLTEDYVEFADRRYQDGYTDGRRSAALDSRAGDAGEEDGAPKGMKRAYVRCRAHNRVAHYDYVPYSFSTAVAVMPCGCDAKNAEQITREQFIAATPAPAANSADDAGEGEHRLCPWCGSQPELVYPPHPEIYYRAGCASDRCEVKPFAKATTIQNAWEAWDSPLFATPAPAVDAVPAGEVERPLNRDDLYRFMDALKLSEKRDVAKAIGFDPAPLPGENDMDRWKRMWAWAAENDKKVALATAIRAALSHGEGRK